MTLRRCSALLALLSTLCLTVTPVWGANKEMIQLQTQVQQLQQQMTAMTRSFDERMGVMKSAREKHRCRQQSERRDRRAASVRQQAAAGSLHPGRPDLRPDSGAQRHHGRAQGPPGQAEQAVRRYASAATVH